MTEYQNLKLETDYFNGKQFYEGMVLSVEKSEFNTDTQRWELELKHCTSYNDL